MWPVKPGRQFSFHPLSFRGNCLSYYSGIRIRSKSTIHISKNQNWRYVLLQLCTWRGLACCRYHNQVYLVGRMVSYWSVLGRLKVKVNIINSVALPLLMLWSNCHPNVETRNVRTADRTESGWCSKLTMFEHFYCANVSAESLQRLYRTSEHCSLKHIPPRRTSHVKTIATHFLTMSV